MSTVIFRHHEPGQPRPKYTRPTINPLPITAILTARSLNVLLLIKVLTNGSKARDVAAKQIKRTIH